MKLFATWLVAAMLFMMPGVLLLFSKGVFRLASWNLTTTGLVLSVVPESHGQVAYEYTVAGKRYEYQDAPDIPNRSITNLRQGDPITVFYYPKDPSTSMLGSPAFVLRSQLSTMAVAAVVLSSFLIMIIHFAGGFRADQWRRARTLTWWQIFSRQWQ